MALKSFDGGTRDAHRLNFTSTLVNKEGGLSKAYKSDSEDDWISGIAKASSCFRKMATNRPSKLDVAKVCQPIGDDGQGENTATEKQLIVQNRRRQLLGQQHKHRR